MSQRRIKVHGEGRERRKRKEEMGSGLKELFKASIINKKQERDRKIREAVERHGYSQKEIAGYLKMHYSTISRLVNQK